MQNARGFKNCRGEQANTRSRLPTGMLIPVDRYYCTLGQPSGPPDDAQHKHSAGSTDDGQQEKEEPGSADLPSAINLTALAHLGVH